MSPDEYYELRMACFDEQYEGDCDFDEERMGDEDCPYEDDHQGLYGSEW